MAGTLAACGGADQLAGTSDTLRAGAQPSCAITVCMAGAWKRQDGANPTVDALCQQAGAIQDCSDGHCQNLFSAFSPAKAAAALFDAADTNGDGRVGRGDDQCRITVVGYSWGGVNAVRVVKRFVRNRRVSRDRRFVDQLVLIDPFKPRLRGRLTIPRQVRRFWSYRHSAAPQADCSSRAPLGPYRGKVPRCSADTRCRDYDFSSEPTRMFGWQRGADVGHCSIVDAAYDAVLQNVVEGGDAWGVPAPTPVSRQR